MTAEDLIAEARRNRDGPPSVDCLTPSVLLECHGIILRCLLHDIDYEGDKESGCAIAARMIAGIAAAEDRMAEDERNEAALASFVVN